MELGRINLDGNRDLQDVMGESRFPESRTSDSIAHDLPRLLLLLFMLMAATFGGICNHYTNTPVKIVKRSMTRTVEHPFRASIEGSTALKSISLAFYRERQHFSPETGLVTEIIERTPGEDGPPFDALTALHALEFADAVVEHDREDMYGHGTRHFNGVLALPGKSEDMVYVFEYWCDIRTYRAVRLIVTEAERNAAVDDRGNAISRETYINIWYYN